MADATIQALERAVAVTPADGSRRLALATALDRAGRRADALRALDLPGCDDLFDERAALAAALWARALGGLAPTGVEAAADGRVEARFDAGGRHVVWEGRSEAVEVGAFDATTGAPLLHAPGHRLLATFDGGLFSHDWRRGDAVTRATFAGGHVQREERSVGGWFVSAAPDGLRVHVLRDGVGFVLAWRGGEVLHELLGARWVDWSTETFVADGERAMVARSFDGGPERVLATGRTWGVLSRLRSLGGGVVVSWGQGLRLLHVVAGWALPLLEATPADLPEPSLSSDRRGLRLVAAERVVRIDVDLARGALRAPVPSGLARRAFSAALFHPHADVAAVYRRERWQLRGGGGPPLLVLPSGASPLAWSPDGERLVVARGEPTRLEVWACGA